MTWFGVKSFYRITALGDPIRVDDDYVSDIDLYEERVVLFEGLDVDAVLSAAETEAESYAASLRHENIYGQRVTCRYLGVCDAFAIDSEPAVGGEVYGNAGEIQSEVSDADLSTRLLAIPGDRSRRKKFLQSDIAAQAFDHR